MSPERVPHEEFAPGVHRLGARLEEVVQGARVRGVEATTVTVVATRWVGTAFLEVTYRDDAGRTETTYLDREREPSLLVERASRAFAFDGDASAFVLAFEALRIGMAAQFDPMVGLSTSDLDPLPHQIRAVYQELLPRTPLRFLLADDPGAGKTIMAGLYIKELLLRGDLARCLIVAPGGLVDQWAEELKSKFGLDFRLLDRGLVNATIASGPDDTVFARHPLLIARMDQLSRSEELTAQLEVSDWDLVVVDEAHRMSAHYFSGELQTTKRYELGRLLGRVTRHLLLMTATPHSGKPEDFQLFLALLDGDRFEGRYRDGVHTSDPSDLMRRMVKEELLTFEGKPLFPERRAYTITYELSEREKDLYAAVTDYVREQMSAADELRREGDGRRAGTVGFALTVLQRRLASSPQAILASLERRVRRLEQRRAQLRAEPGGAGEDLAARLARLLGRDVAMDTDDPDELSSEEQETLEEEVVDAASAARTITELDGELLILRDLVELARVVHRAGTDAKWSQLRSILLDAPEMHDASGARRKLIVFTEHKDTLAYLVDGIRALLGREEAVVSISGSTVREERRAIQERFTQDDETLVLVATDAAGEGLNLQRAHLMVNYDLPWNPNRIEQRFGRIHRIGQTEVCHLWNLVAADTREGQVFVKLFDKIEEQRKAYDGRIFDVLGEAFTDQPLRQLLMQAVRYGDEPATRARLEQVVDAEVSKGLQGLLAERALSREVLAEADVQGLRLLLEEARSRRLQPRYVQAFVLEALARLGGTVRAREPGRWQVTHVPGDIRSRDRVVGLGAPVLPRYQRVTFDPAYLRVEGQPVAALLAPGHPLVDAVVDLVRERHRALLKQGTVLVDRDDLGEDPRLLVAVTQQVTDGHAPPLTVLKRFDFVELLPDGSSRPAGPAPYLDLDPATEAERALVAPSLDEPWLAGDVESRARDWAVATGLGGLLPPLRQQVDARVAKVRGQVRSRLLAEINYWDHRHATLLDDQAAGKKLRVSPETALGRARRLETQLERRLEDLAREQQLRPRPPVIAGAALVVPQGLLDRLAGRAPEDVARHARETARVERRAVDAVLAAERALDRDPQEMPHNNPGYDIRSLDTDGHLLWLEVKGRVVGAPDFVMTRTELLFAQQNGPQHRLALVEVGGDPADDRVRYVADGFNDEPTPGFGTTKVIKSWRDYWARGYAPS